MKKTMKKYIEILDILFSEAFVVVPFLIGIVLHDVLVRIDIQKAEENITVFPLGTVMGLIGLILVLFFVGATSMCQRFDLVLGLGGTRKEFFIERIIYLTLSSTICVATLFLLAGLEKIRLDKFWSQYPIELDLMPFFTLSNFLIAILGIVGLSLFIASIIMHFGKVGFWIIWAVYMLGCMCLSKADDLARSIDPQLASRIMSSSFYIKAVIVVIALLGAIVSWIFISKQSVTN